MLTHVDLGDQVCRSLRQEIFEDRYAELAQRARVETDAARAKTVYRDLTQLLLDESFVMPITMQRTTWAMSQQVKGFDYTALEVQLLAGVSLAG